MKSTTLELADATKATIAALVDNDHTAHAAAVKRSMTDVLHGGATATIETLQQWLALIDEAYDLISGSGDDCTADETADLAAYYIRKEIRTIEAATRIPLTTYDQLNGRLQDAYDLLGNLPLLADLVLEARVQRVVELLDDLTYDTYDADKIAEAGIDPNGPVERTLRNEAA